MADRNDPYRGSRYLVEIEGIIQAGFSEVTVSDSSQDPIEYREGNEPPTVRKIPGLVKYGNVTLKWGITSSMDLYNWRKLVEQGKMKEARRNIAILIFDEEGNPAARWEFAQAWPSKYEAPNLDATADQIAVETLEIAYEGMNRVE